MFFFSGINHLVNALFVSCSYFTWFFCRGQNALHILGQYGRENAAAIFELFIEAMPHYPINKPDMEGNTSKYFCIPVELGIVCVWL